MTRPPAPTPGRWSAARLVAPVILAALSIALVQTEWLWRLDLVAYDLVQRLPPTAPPPDVVLVAIDDASLQQLGRWPWDRRVHAELVRKLSNAGAKGIALDIAFTEPDDDDAVLASALRSSGRVVLPMLHEQSSMHGVPVESLPVPPLARAAAALGHVDVDVDPDGMVRTAYLEAGLGRPAWPCLALALLRLDPAHASMALPGERDPESGTPAPYAWVRDRRVLVGYAGAPGHFRRVSYVDVLGDRTPDGWLAGAFVFVGPTATGLGDQVPTPVSGVGRPMSGIEFNANVLEALRRGTMAGYLAVGPACALTGALVFAASLVLSLARRQVPVVVAALVVVFGVSWGLLSWSALWFTPMPAVAGVLLAYPIASTRWHAQSVARERARTQQALGSLSEGVITADAEGRIDYMNPAAEAWVGTGIGRDLAAVLRVAGDARADAASRDGVPVEATVVARDGTRLPVTASVVVLGDRHGPPLGTIVALSLRQPSEDHVAPSWRAAVGPPGAEGRASEAPPTARAQLEARLARLIADASRLGRHLGVLALDITQLRTVNVAFGRKGGDALLQAVGDRLRGAVREREAVIHAGGDEFVILLEGVSRRDDILALASRLSAVFGGPFLVEGVEVRVRACIGIASYPEHGSDAEALLERAETAKVWAREHDEAPVQLYGAHMSTPALDRLVLERALQAALEGDELTLVYQPQVDISTGRLVGAEALVRWHHPQFGTIPASTLVTLAEETQLIVGLGDWVLRTACRQLAAWRARGYLDVRVAVNVSPRQFLLPGLAETIDQTLRECQVPASALEIEVTETALVGDVERARVTLEQVKAMGVAIALDDFGVGYSSLVHLSRLPVDCVKIDRSFVDNVAVDGHDRTICLAVLAMAQSMRRRVVAEGVETADQMRFFASKGCDVVQGYYISRPVAAGDFERMMATATEFPHA